MSKEPGSHGRDISGQEVRWWQLNREFPVPQLKSCMVQIVFSTVESHFAVGAQLACSAVR